MITNNICEINHKRELIQLGLTFKAPITTALLADLLPSRIYHEDDDYFLKMNKGTKGWGIWYETNSLGLQIVEDQMKERRNYLFQTSRREYNMVNALASYLIMLLQAGILTAEDCNNKMLA